DGDTFRPRGSAWAANAARASPIRPALTRGSRTQNVCPVRGRANPYTYSHSYRVRPHDRGRRPLSAQTRRAIGLSPSRASSSAPTSTRLSGCRRRSRASRRRRSFPPPPAGRRAGRRRVPRPGDPEGEPEVPEPPPPGLGPHLDPPPVPDVGGHLRPGPQPAVRRPPLQGDEQLGPLSLGQPGLAPVALPTVD